MNDSESAVGFAVERAVRTWLAAQGVKLIPCTEFSGRNHEDRRAPVVKWIEGGRVEVIPLPDFIRIPEFSGLEIKARGYAPEFKRAGKRTTGIRRAHYDAYQRFQQITGRPVELLFVHLTEDTVVGGQLDRIAEAMAPDINPKVGGATVYWDFDVLPEPFWPNRVTDIIEEAARSSRTMGRDGFTQGDLDLVRAYFGKDAATNKAAHAAEWAAATMLPDFLL